MQTVILIDDEFYFRQAMKRYLSEWSGEYQMVGEAKNGKEGLELIRQLRPDIVLMDINMQIMSGLDAMKVLYEEKIASKVILLTGYSEFEYAHQAIRFGVVDYLLKPVDKQELKKSLDQVNAQIQAEKRYKELQVKYYSASFKVKEHFVNKIFSAKNEADWSEAKRMADDLLKQGEPFGCQVFLINIGSGIKDAGKKEDNSVSFFTISNVLTELLERREILCFTSIVNNTLRAVASGNMPPDELEKTVLEIQKNSREYVEKMIEAPVLISFGSAREKLRELGDSVQEAYQVQKFMRMYRKKGVCTSAQLTFTGEKTGQFFSTLYTQLMLFIRTNNREGMETLVNHFFQEMKEKEEHPETVLQSAVNMISCSYDMLQKFLGEVKSENEELRSSKAIQRPGFEGDSIEQIQEKVRIYIGEIMERINEHLAKKKTSLSSKVSQYIEQNYHRYDLSLMELSTTFGMSKTILCQQFKDAFGITIGDCILNCRMQRAREMMDEGYHNVAYIAEKCGYEDAGYFSKCFKKYFGVSPKAYCERRE